MGTFKVKRSRKQIDRMLFNQRGEGGGEDSQKERELLVIITMRNAETALPMAQIFKAVS
jgi:hypothetical protein